MTMHDLADVDRRMVHAVRLELADKVIAGERFHEVKLMNGEGISELLEMAEGVHWHVKGVWRGEAAVTYVVLRYEAP